MRALIQVVKNASVEVDSTVIGRIQKGFVVFVGYSDEDDEKVCDKLLAKLMKLRIFSDENGKTNLSLQDVGGNILFISQFTLYAICKKGNRPSFIKSAGAAHGRLLYDYSINLLKGYLPNLQCGEFGADMLVNIENNGPFTLMLDSEEI